MVKLEPNGGDISSCAVTLSVHSYIILCPIYLVYDNNMSTYLMFYTERASKGQCFATS